LAPRISKEETVPYFSRHVLEGPHLGEILLSGRFQPNGSGAISDIVGAWITSVARTAAGIYTITMATKFQDFAGYYSAHATLQTTTAQPTVSVGIGAISLSAGTVVVHTAIEDGVSGISAAGDVSATTGTYINVFLSMKYGGSPDGSGL
jgi:hypothetical protein